MFLENKCYFPDWQPWKSGLFSGYIGFMKQPLGITQRSEKYIQWGLYAIECWMQLTYHLIWSICFYIYEYLSLDFSRCLCKLRAGLQMLGEDHRFRPLEFHLRERHFRGLAYNFVMSLSFGIFIERMNLGCARVGKLRSSSMGWHTFGKQSK